MGNKTILILLGLVVLGFIVGRSVAHKVADGINFEGARLRWGSFSLSGVALTLFLKFSNRNSISIPVDNFTGQLIYKNTNIANLDLNKPVLLTAGQSTELEINTNISFIDLAVDVIQLIKDKNLKDIRLNGSVTIKGISAPIDYGVTSS